MAENGLSIQLKLGANFSNRKRRIFVINFRRNFMLSLRDTACYFYHFLIGAQSKEVPIQKEFRIYSKQGFFVIPNVS